MAYEDPNAPLNPDVAATNEGALPEKKAGSWEWLWHLILIAVIVKFFGVVGGLVAFGAYHVLKPKLGTWGAIAASGFIGVVVAMGFVAMIR